MFSSTCFNKLPFLVWQTPTKNGRSADSEMSNRKQCSTRAGRRQTMTVLLNTSLMLCLSLYSCTIGQLHNHITRSFTSIKCVLNTLTFFILAVANSITQLLCFKVTVLVKSLF